MNVAGPERVSHGLRKIIALSAVTALAGHGAAVTWAAGFPINNIEGAPVRPPSTDPHVLAGIWAPASGSLGSQGLPDDVEPGESPSNVAWENPLPVLPATQTLVDLLTTLSARNTPVTTPHLTCRPNGIAGVTAPKFPVVIVQTPNELFLVMEEDRDVYRLRLGGAHRANLKPTYNGDSVARWEGTTLVVDTIGYNGLGMLDENWHPVSAQAHLVQRFTKSADGRHLDIEVTLEDPVYYSKTLRMKERWDWGAGEQQLENDCSEYPVEAPFKMIAVEKRFEPACTSTWDAASNSSKITCRYSPTESAKR